MTVKPLGTNLACFAVTLTMQEIFLLVEQQPQVRCDWFLGY